LRHVPFRAGLRMHDFVKKKKVERQQGVTWCSSTMAASLIVDFPLQLLPFHPPSPLRPSGYAHFSGESKAASLFTKRPAAASSIARPISRSPSMQSRPLGRKLQLTAVLPPSSHWYRAFPYSKHTPSEAAKLRGVPCLYVKKAGASDSESLRHLLIPNESQPFLLSDLHVLPQIALLRHICDSGAGFSFQPRSPEDHPTDTQDALDYCCYEVGKPNSFGATMSQHANIVPVE
jgi:hypothetical protein